MIRFEPQNRDYTEAKTSYRTSIPADFNFAYDVIDARARERDKTALLAISADGETAREIRFSDLADQSSKFANGLKRMGLAKGDFACMVVGRIPEWYSALFGCMKLGVVSMPGTNLLTSKDIAYRVQQSSAKAVIVTAEHCEKVESIRAECPTLEHLILIGAPRAGWQTFNDIVAAESAEIDRAAEGPFAASDMMMAYFTSGTTAMPKMVPRDHGYAIAHAATGLFWMDLREDDIHWTLTDTGWAKAAWGMLFPQLLIGSTIVLLDAKGFDVDLHLKLIGDYKITTFCAPPTVYRLFAQQNLHLYDLSSLRRCMGAGEPLNPEVIRYWQENTGTTIADGYGQTETINIVANFPGQETKFGSMGQPVPGFDIDVVDDDGKRLPVDEVGHIAVKVEGPDGWPPGLFHGYLLADGSLDTAAFRHGWYFTGDTARKDAGGYFWFVGRADDLISSAGYRISPFEVESALLEHPAVMESAVVGHPDPTRGQLVKAFVILAAGQLPSPALAQEIQDFCKELTAPYKYPRIVEFVDELPKTISGKIRRVELREGG